MLLSGCDRMPDAATLTASVVPADLEEPVIPAQLPEEAIALRRLEAQWPQTAAEAKQDPMHHALLGRHMLPQLRAGNRMLLVYASRLSSADCNACSPDLSFFEFQISAANAQPVLVMASVKAASLGYASEAPNHQVQLLGGKLYAVVMNWNENAQGSYSLLSVLMPVAGKMREVFNEQMGGSHDQVVGTQGSMVHVDWKTDYSFQHGPGPYLDLHLERHFLEGQRLLLDPRNSPVARELTADGRVPSHLIYRFDGQRYRRVLAEQFPMRKNYECLQNEVACSELWRKR